MSEELKPCPHCGLGGDEIELLEDRERVIVSHYVYCDGCGARTGYKFSGEAAIAAWNRRAPSPDMREALEALTTAVHAHYVKAFEDYGIAREVLQADPEVYHGALDTIATMLRSLTGAKP